MRSTLLTLVIIGLVAGAGSARAPLQAPQAPAAQLPDDMAIYYAVFLRRGPAWTAAATPETTALSRAHRENIERLTKEGLMVVAGPFLDQTGDRALAGLFVLRVGSPQDAKAVVEGDPAVKAGRFVYEIVPWLGPKSLKG